MVSIWLIGSFVRRFSRGLPAIAEVASVLSTEYASLSVELNQTDVRML